MIKLCSNVSLQLQSFEIKMNPCWHISFCLPSFLQQELCPKRILYIWGTETNLTHLCFPENCPKHSELLNCAFCVPLLWAASTQHLYTTCHKLLGFKDELCQISSASNPHRVMAMTYCDVVIAPCCQILYSWVLPCTCSPDLVAVA